MQMNDIMRDTIKSLIDDWPKKKSQKINRAVANYLNHPELKHQWIYLGYLPHGLAIVLILFLITYLCTHICMMLHKRNQPHIQEYRHKTQRFSFVALYRHLGQRQKVYSHQWASLSFLIDSSKGIITFPETFQSAPALQLEEEIAFPPWENVEGFDCFLLFRGILGMYHITSFQHPPQGLTESRECWPEFGPGTESALQPGSVSTELNVDVAFFKTVKKKLVKYCGPVWGFFSPSLRWEKPFICFRTESE